MITLRKIKKKKARDLLARGQRDIHLALMSSTIDLALALLAGVIDKLSELLIH